MISPGAVTAARTLTDTVMARAGAEEIGLYAERRAR
ncbi:hypothetical protein CAPI_02380 [Corynebacterium capitovis DSM 44611]|nr:hypothetical protein CAPI_02380 [Corynebacterium capitovis DSM 44611]